MTDEMKKWIAERIAEHKQGMEQALANANGHAGALKAFELLLAEFSKKEVTDG